MHLFHKYGTNLKAEVKIKDVNPNIKIILLYVERLNTEIKNQR